MRTFFLKLLGAGPEAFGGTGAVRSVAIHGRHSGRPSSNNAEVSGFKLPLSAFLLCLLPWCASAATDPSLLPDQRQTVELRAGERNPFAQQIVQESQTTAGPDTASEESRLRRILRAVKVSGLSGGGGKFQVLLGSIIIKPGDILPPLVGNQFEVLRVLSVDDSSLTLAFVEKDPSVDPRQIVLPIGIKPDVASFMYGEAVEQLIPMGTGGKPSLPPVENPGVGQFLKGSQDSELKGMADRAVKLMGVGRDAKETEQ